MDVAERPRTLRRFAPAGTRRLLLTLGAAFPLFTVFVWLCLLYGWEAWGNPSPWLVTDEFERAQLSRSVARTGHEALRGVPHPFDTLYVYLIAPAWWINDTVRAYGAVKAIGVATMTAVIFPSYVLARTLVSKRWAIFAATGTAMIPALSYSSLLLEEPLAYFWSGLCFALLARALITPRRWWIAAATLACLLAPAVRDQLVVMVPGAAVAAFSFWFSGDGGRRVRRNWRIWHWLGFALLVVVALALFQWFAANHSAAWAMATEEFPHRMFTYGLWALGALTIGVGVLPTIATLTALVKPRGEAMSRAHRAYVCITVSMIAVFAFYTAVKAAFVSRQGLTFLTERNVIYLAPLLFAGTAYVFERRRPRVVALVVATACALYLVTTTPYKIEFHFFFDAPGLSILQSLNRVFATTPQDAKILLIVLAVGSFAVLAAARFVPRAGPVIVAAAALFVLGWNGYGEIAAARASHEYANQLVSNMPRPLNWIDEAVPADARVYYLGQSIVDPNGVLQLEFWNSSLQRVWSTDGTAPGPGPNITTEVHKPNGELATADDVQYAVSDFGISLVGRVIETKYHLGGGAPLPWTLYKITPPLRVRQTFEGIYTDGWGKPETALNQYSIADDAPSYLVVHVSRAGGGKTLPAKVRVRVGSIRVALGREGLAGEQPFIDRPLFAKSVRVRRNLDHTFIFEAPRPPFRVETSITPFSPYLVDHNSSDRRELGAQVDYRIVRILPKPQPDRSAEVTGIDPDGWMRSDASYTQWSTPYEQGGFARVTVSRKQWNGPDKPGRVTMTVSSLKYDEKLNLVTDKVFTRRKWTVHSSDSHIFLLPTPDPPFRVNVHVSPTFVPHRLDPRFADTRHLGAQVMFGFKPI